MGILLEELLDVLHVLLYIGANAGYRLVLDVYLPEELLEQTDSRGQLLRGPLYLSEGGLDI